MINVTNKLINPILIKIKAVLLILQEYILTYLEHISQSYRLRGECIHQG